MAESERADVLGDIFDSLRLVPVIHGQLVLGAPWGLSLERGELVHFYVVARGLAWVELPGKKGCTASAGDVLIFPRGAAHALRDAPGSPAVAMNPKVCRRHGIAREPRRLGGPGPQTMLIAGGYRVLAEGQATVLDSLPDLLHLSTTDRNVAEWLKPLVDMMLAEATSLNPGGGAVLSRLADVMLIQALRAMSSRGRCKESVFLALGDATVSKALSLMHARPAEPWTVNRLASLVGVSRSGFAARFTRLVGESPLHYLSRWRMTQAAQLLRGTADTLPAIAAKVGYGSDAAFNKAFKRAYGKAPGRFRRADAESA